MSKVKATADICPRQFTVMEPPISKWRIFWTSNPPIVIFILCLASFGITTFSLSVYVAQADKIRNPNVLDWNRLLKHLSKLDYCLPKQSTLYNITNVQPDSGWSNVTLSVPVSKEFSDAFYQSNQDSISAGGHIQVKHLGRGLPELYLEDFLVIKFLFPPKKLFRETEDVCLSVQGPKGLLQYLERVNDTSCHNEYQGMH